MLIAPLLATINNKPFVDFGLDGGGVGLATDRAKIKAQLPPLFVG